MYPTGSRDMGYKMYPNERREVRGTNFPIDSIKTRSDDIINRSNDIIYNSF